MSQLVERLLAGSGASRSSHPLLVSLLEVAAARPGVFDRGKGSAVGRGLSRHWERVCGAFRGCLAVGVTDSDVLAACPLDGFTLSGEGWYVGKQVGSGYRLAVALALEEVASRKSENGLEKRAVGSVADLRALQRRNRLSPFGKLPVCPARVESGLVNGRLVVSWVIHGARVFFVLACDEVGKVRCVGHRETKASALELLNPESVKP